jgi:hypothetical protein
VANLFPSVGPPKDGLVYRVARGFDLFAPPDWAWAKSDGTFTNRFDDPGAYHGIPAKKRFRMIYCATQRAGAFAETTAYFRKSPKTIAGLSEIEDDEEDPELIGGVIPESWRLERSIGVTRLSEASVFADIMNPRALQILRERLAPLLTQFGLADFDISAVTSQERRLTQEAARYVYELANAGLVFNGIRYTSRLNQDWELWAIFSDRMVHEEEFFATIRHDDPGLLEAAALFGLTIE